ncbi:MAG: ABC transporter permease subunit [Planctomycetes bacterium]|nr:ABC transporter permease subunit [Planctomycetota bacterium]
MSFTNIKLIFGREIRDQFRDRRTLFMIAVLPVLFYPLLGFSFFQIAQFLQEEPSRVLVVGREDFVDLPALFATDGGFDKSLFAEEKKARLMKLEFRSLKPSADGVPAEPLSEAAMRGMVERGEYEAIVYFPPDFAQKLEDYRVYLKEQVAGRWPPNKPRPQVPSPVVISDNRQAKSQEAGARVTVPLTAWSEDVGTTTLKQSNVDPKPPVLVKRQYVDGRPEANIDTSLWSKVLPFVLLIWAVTGAFYPAIDLCAGEKERGTLETLLTSPAQRGEIVMGKLMTVMVFSMITAVLNLVSMGITGFVVMRNLGALPQMANVGPPPLASLFWLVLILIPVSALFSAVCLALAAFARSTKEGQYYLMPVILVTMPLILLPMAPSAELNLGSSLIPVSGIVLLMRSTMEGTIVRLWPYAIPVMAVTLCCCWIAIRWAIDQFSSEAVLFREGERWDISSWMKHLIRDRQPTPSVAMAVMCGVLILVLMFFFRFLVAPDPYGHQPDIAFLFKVAIVIGVAIVATPALIMSVMLTRDPARTLLLPMRLNLRSLIALLSAPLLAIFLFPVIYDLHLIVQYVYPLRSPEVELFSKVVTQIQPGSNLFWLGWLALAVTPAICEELAFRGFILSGLRHQGHKWRAIAISSLMFGVAHGILQQSIVASLLGCVLGYLAIQSGALWPGVLYHFTHNSIAYLTGLSAYKLEHSSLAWLQVDYMQVRVFRVEVLFVCLLFAGFIFLLFASFPYRRTHEEALQERMDHESAQALAS